jgi:NAD/NADP transhydrogenase beta subunit
MAKQRSSLRDALDFRLFSEVLKYDLYIALAGLVGGVLAEVKSITALPLLIAVAAGLVGVIIGAVIAGVAVLAAFMDQSFLRKLKAINREPVRYLAPFIFTAVIGVIASLTVTIQDAGIADNRGCRRGGMVAHGRPMP